MGANLTLCIASGRSRNRMAVNVPVETHIGEKGFGVTDEGGIGVYMIQETARVEMTLVSYWGDQLKVSPEVAQTLLAKVSDMCSSSVKEGYAWAFHFTSKSDQRPTAFHILKRTHADDTKE
jgi:hypothetical protein